MDLMIVRSDLLVEHTSNKLRQTPCANANLTGLLQRSAQGMFGNVKIFPTDTLQQNI